MMSQPARSEEEASLIPKPSTNPTKKLKKRKKKKKKKPVNWWKLLMNINFLFFAANCVTPLGLFVWWFVSRPDAAIPYIMSGVLGMIVAVVGYRHFNQLIALTKEANVFNKNNKKMRSAHRHIRKDVNKIKRANKDLRGTEVRLRAANKKNQQNLTNFRDVQTFMKQLNIEDFKQVTNKATNLGKSWRDELLQQERNMLHLIFDRYEMNQEQGKKGMNKAEFVKFAECLPDQYKQRFARLGTFDKLSNNKNILEYADFEMVLDVFAEMMVDDVDIDLEIVQDSTPNTTLDMLPSNISEADSLMTDYDSSEEEDGGGFGFLTKLNTWRKEKKDDRLRHSASRRVVTGKKQTTPTGSKASSRGYGFGLFDSGKSDKKDKNIKYKQQEVEEEEEKAAVKPKGPKKTASVLNAMHNVDDVSLDDDEINAYMQQQNND